MTTKHTPGPWYAVHNGHYWNVSVDPADTAPSIGDACGSRFLDGQEDNPVAEANAKLMAASPAMLDALRECVEALSQDSLSNVERARYLGTALAAIARAEG
jgi:hypothetical protein